MQPVVVQLYKEPSFPIDGTHAYERSASSDSDDCCSRHATGGHGGLPVAYRQLEGRFQAQWGGYGGLPPRHAQELRGQCRCWEPDGGKVRKPKDAVEPRHSRSRASATGEQEPVAAFPRSSESAAGL